MSCKDDHHCLYECFEETKCLSEKDAVSRFYRICDMCSSHSRTKFRSSASGSSCSVRKFCRRNQVVCISFAHFILFNYSLQCSRVQRFSLTKKLKNKLRFDRKIGEFHIFFYSLAFKLNRSGKNANDTME